MSTLGAVSLWRPIGAGGQANEGAPGTSGPIRLTRRGRVVSGVVVLVAAAWLVVLVISRAVAAAPGYESAAVHGSGAGLPAAAAMATVTVQDGDSLWAIAQRLAPQADTREVVSQMRDVNGLSSSLIQPGQVLLVPAAP